MSRRHAPARCVAQRAAGWLPCACLLGALLLGGCASLDALRPTAAETPDDEPTVHSPGTGTEAADKDDAGHALYDLVIDAPAGLRDLLASYLDLSRFRTAPASEAVTPAEVDRLIAAAPAQARALLETEGYFSPVVEATRHEPPLTTPMRPQVRVRVDPGPRAQIAELDIEPVGAMQEAIAAGDADAKALLARLRRQSGLQPGRPFRQDDWRSAKATLLATLRAEGYPTAEWRRTHARVDVATQRVQLALVADSGPLFRLGPLGVEGLDKHDDTTARNLAMYTPGERYSEKKLLDYQERLQAAGLYEGATVELVPDPARAHAAEVLVRIKELPLQQATVGIGYSANTGPRLSLEHTHRRVFGQRWVAKNKFELGPKRSLWQGDLTSHPLADQYRNLLAGNLERLETDNELRTAWSARIGRIQDTERIERLYFVEYVHARLDTPAGNSNNEALSYNYHWIWRDVDSVLLPTRGSTWSLQAGVGYAASTTLEDGPFTRAYGRATYYLPLGKWFGTVRAEAAQLFVRDSVGVPDTLLFRAGGDESVRGYAFRTLGPKVNGAVTSGRVMATASVELARPISARRPEFQWAVFVDAGNAENEWRDLDPVLGYGLGLRWRSPVGPLRLDLAYGHEIEKFRLHLSVGVAF